MWKVSGRWRGELPIGETPAEGCGKEIEKKGKIYFLKRIMTKRKKGKLPIGEPLAEGCKKK